MRRALTAIIVTGLLLAGAAAAHAWSNCTTYTIYGPYGPTLCRQCCSPGGTCTVTCY
jgi:hypothetical protein